MVMKEKMWRSERFLFVGGAAINYVLWCMICMVVVWKISTGAGCGGCEQPVEATHSLQSGLLFCDDLFLA